MELPFDRLGWHEEAAAHHIGVFLAWVIQRELIGIRYLDMCPREVEDVRHRRMTGPQFFLRCCYERFGPEALNDEGVAFAEAYYDYHYFDDHATLGPSYQVEDTWENYDRLAIIIDRRYEEWKRGAHANWTKAPPVYFDVEADGGVVELIERSTRLPKEWIPFPD